MSKRKVSVLGIIFTMILAVVIILLFERVMFDINRLANPVIDKTVSQDMDDEYYDRQPVPYHSASSTNEKSSTESAGWMTHISTSRVSVCRSSVSCFERARNFGCSPGISNSCSSSS